ncbi:unnamed protein product [Thelazia callipaeda]|uniref:E2F-associated phosphoprotein n=1 Tax=Thelazia callipaeda TaxID=103827 RepID=A0A0N5CN32_THECL|nr:unnamed protein product [Thelazia callipaeda]
MSRERLIPLETMEKDYYLDDRNDWFSDGERENSESSDDGDDGKEFLRSSGKFSGCRSAPCKKLSRKDEFESDMDDELDNDFVTFTAKIFTPSGKRNVATLKEDISDPSKFILTEKSSFDDENNLLRKAVNKIGESTEKEVVEFYDSEEDEDNELWVRHHREQLKIIKPRNKNESDFGEDNQINEKVNRDSETDAVLSCPACMSLLTRDCQKHEFYHNQYRAIFVENCDVIENEVLFLPQSRKNERKARKNTAGIRPNAVVSPGDVLNIPKEDLFHPVHCSVCQTKIGVYDCEEASMVSGSYATIALEIAHEI